MSSTLDKIKIGEKVRVVKIASGGILRKRLVEMGILSGAIITLVRIAPLGDPLEIKVKGANISLRRREAAGIKVEKISRKK